MPNNKHRGSQRARNLREARRARNDEFYTQYGDIQKEMDAYIEYDPDVFRNKAVLLPCDDPEWSNFTKFFAQNFQRFGLKKLISTSYAENSKLYRTAYRPTLFETQSEKFDKKKTVKHGKIFTLTHDISGDGRVDIADLGWDYLDGDGDFRSNEVRRLCDEADMVVTNPPFSLFRQFLAWVIQANKKFIMISNMNAATYTEIFPLLKNNKIWFGVNNGAKIYGVPDYYKRKNTFINADGRKYAKMGNTGWFTNVDHGRRHQPLSLMTMANNLKHSKRKEVRGRTYQKYDNYDALEVPYTAAIPCDYQGVMGVPISFLDKYNPGQFEILGCDYDVKEGVLPDLINPKWKGKLDRGYINGKRIYSRILIKRR